MFVCRRLYYFLLLLMPGIHSASAQTPQKIEIVNADVSEYDEELFNKATRLLGNVVFRHKKAMMYCDSAYLFREENRLEAFNNIRITQGDSLNLTGDRLLYEGNTQMAQVFGDVVMTDRKMTLRTTRLDYNLQTEVAYYPDSANIVDGPNTLTSKTGTYFSTTKDMHFRKDVLLVNPSYTMNSDTLRYNTLSKIAYFLGPTFIRSKNNLIYCENGWYDTEKQISTFTLNSYLQSGSQKLSGDSVVYNRNLGLGRVFGNVRVQDTINRITIAGNYGEHYELNDSSWVTGRALMTQVMENNDSLFLHGDTLMAVRIADDTITRKRNLFAFHGVRLFNKDMQGRCDSLVYMQSDSTIRLFYDPVIWSGLNQLTADSVYMQTANSEITHIYLNSNSFIASRTDSLGGDIIDSLPFNQIKGKDMVGHLTENKLYRIDVNGNGQTIYYTKDKNEKNFGVNRADCSDLVIYVEDNEVNSITLLNDPEGTLYPIKELPVKDLRLKGFSWHENKRPVSRDDLFDKK